MPASENKNVDEENNLPSLNDYIDDADESNLPVRQDSAGMSHFWSFWN
jgi:hypothetical protein